MRRDHLLTLHLNCAFCSTRTTLTIASVSLSLDQPINCPVCGGDLGKLGGLIDPGETGSGQADASRAEKGIGPA